ncbi:MAG TPA: pilin [Candidatus Saccharimonadales bacterium]|nr:pilin [Candidatus Saccharimonadales bacterium]
MKRIGIILTTLLLGLGIGGLLAPMSVAAATPKSTVCTALGSNADCSQQPSNGISIDHVITVIINLLSVVVAIASVIMIIVAGFKYVTSRGESSAIASAKNTMIYAIVGLVIVALAQVIVQFVLGKVNAPDCPSGQTLNDKNKCVKVGANLVRINEFAVIDQRYILKSPLS